MAGTITRIGLRTIFGAVFFVVNRKQREIVLFGNAFGFFDNSKYLFLRAVKSKSDNCFWVAKSSAEYRHVSDKGLPVVQMYSWQWFVAVTKAKAVFVTHGIPDVAPSLCRRTTVINLWHGYPMKKMGYDSRIDARRVARRKMFFLDDVYSKWDYMLAANETSRRWLMSATHLPINRFIVSGQPRNSGLSEGRIFSDVVLYMPTFRDDGRMDHIKDMVDEWDNIHAHTGLRLCMKLHPLERFDVTNLLKSKEWCVEARALSADLDPQEMLARCTMLVSDYSSVVFDYLQTGRKIVIYAPDEVAYLQARGGEFYIDYKEIKNNLSYVTERGGLLSAFVEDATPCELFIEKYREFREVDLIERFISS